MDKFSRHTLGSAAAVLLSAMSFMTSPTLRSHAREAIATLRGNQASKTVLASERNNSEKMTLLAPLAGSESFAPRAGAQAKTTEWRPTATDRLMVSENFDKMTSGSIATPDATKIVGEINSSLTATAGWVTATGHQAGGCLYIDDYAVEHNGQTMQVRLLDTPTMSITSGSDLFISFKAMSKAKSDNVYALAVNAASSATVTQGVVAINNQWEEYGIFLEGCPANTYIELQSENSPIYLDDVKVYLLGAPEAPEIKPASGVSQAGFTANWVASAGAEGYVLHPTVTHVADGIEPYYIVNTDFSSVTQGSISSPVLPQYVVESLDDIIGQPGWAGRMILRAGGYIGLTNNYLSQYGNSLLQSPTLDLSNNSGEVNIEISYQTPDVDMFQVSLYNVLANGSVSLRSSKMIYSYERFNQTLKEEFTIAGGTTSCMLVVTLPETTKGTIFIDDLKMWQQLPEGTLYNEPLPTQNTTATSAYVSTPHARANDSFSYYVRAYRIVEGNVIFSGNSKSIRVGDESPDEPSELGKALNVKTVADGSRFDATWDAVPGANAYEVTLYREHESDGNELAVVIDEPFDGIVVGTTDLDYPRAMGEDFYDRLDGMTRTPGWEVYQGFYVDGAVGILGYWNMLGMGCYMTSPKFDLSADGGNMMLSLKVGSDYYNQGATIYLAHENPETGALVYDDIFPLDEMEKGFHQFTSALKGGREDSFLVFFPYGYGVSYFDDIKVTQRVPAGTSRTQIARVTATTNSTSMSVPGFVPGDKYYIMVKPVWINTTGQTVVQGEESDKAYIEGLTPTLLYTGVVNNDEGNYISGAVVTLTDNETGERRSATANRWGLFRVENIKNPDGIYTASVSAKGYRPVSIPNISFATGDINDVEIIMHASADNEMDLGIHTGMAECGPADLLYKASDTETIYPASAIALPKGAKILSVAYDGICEREKNVKVTFTLHGENCLESGYDGTPTPADIANLDMLSQTQCKIPKGGSETSPIELVKFTLDSPFEYGGGALRLRVQARANGFVNASFASDATRMKNSVRRVGDSEEEFGDWEHNSEGMPVARISYLLSSGIGEALTDGINSLAMEGGKGCITLRGNCDTPVCIYDTQGRKVATVALTGSPVTIHLPAGVYVSTGSLKAIVK